MQETQALQEMYHGYMKKMQGIRDELAARGAILKDEPHVSLYTWVTRELNAARDRQALLILLEIANHADEFGWCFPSIQRLGKLTGYDHNPGSTVECAVSRLMQKDWLRVKATRNVRRKRTETDFVLSPQILFIRPELRDSAWERFNEVPPCNSWEILVTNLTKPDTEPKSVTTYTNQIQKPDTEPPPPPPSRTEKEKITVVQFSAPAQPPPTTRTAQNNTALETSHSDENRQSQDSAQRNSEATDSAAKNPPPDSAPPPPHPPLPEDFNPAEPLPDAQDEAAAQDLYRMLHSLQLRHARRYVARYDRVTVLAAANVAIRTPHIKNPVGKMDSDLRKSLADSADIDKPLHVQNGEYSDFFKR